MSNLLNKLKPSSHSTKSSQSTGAEQQFTIQPHPAKTNNPADLSTHDPPQPGGGLASSPEWQAHNNPGPYVPREGLKDVEQPKTRDELRARSAELNSGSGR